MQPEEIKSVVSALVLPPAGPLLLGFLGLALALRWRRLGLSVAALGLGTLTVLGSHAVALWLYGVLLERPQPISPDQLAARKVQAIVVLGSGVLPEAPEYGFAQPSPQLATRLRYAAWLSRRTGVPVAFAGGVGWSAAGTASASEGAVAARVLQEDFGIPLRWNDDRSRDTRENARYMARLLRPDGVQRIALVTEAWHMQRSLGHFRAQGFEVLPAPTALPGWRSRPVHEWLPSLGGLELSHHTLREWLGLRFAPPDASPAP